MKTPPNITAAEGRQAVSCSGSLPDTRSRYQKYYDKLKLNPAKYEARLKQLRRGADRQKEKEKSNPDLWEARIQKQRQRRANPGYRESMNAVERERARALPDGTVAAALNLKVGECPKELIEIKRAHMLLNRALGRRIKTP